MPLVVPGINSNSSTSDWQNKLMGKTLTDSSSSSETSFAKKDLPKNHRVVEAEGGMMTMDHVPDRLNVHVDKDGLVKKVTHG